MKQKLCYSILLFLPTLVVAQEAKIKVLPFVNAITSVKAGQIEAGPEFNWQNVEKGNTFILRPYIRMPLTNNTNNVLAIDRFSSTWRGVLDLQYTKDNTKASGSISRHSINGQFELGATDYNYYPTGDLLKVSNTTGTSYAFELKYIGFFTKGSSGAKQFSPQFRLRYAHNWQASDAVGVVNPADSNGVVTTSEMIVDPPFVVPTFSPAHSLQFYPGKGSFSYSPTIYYNFIGNEGTNNPFGNVNRVRLEYWAFFYPLIAGNPNVKFGLSPFLDIRTAGADGYNKVEYGGLITVKFGTSFLQFF